MPVGPPKPTAVIVDVTVTVPPPLMLPETEAAGVPPIMPPVMYSIVVASAAVGNAIANNANKITRLILYSSVYFSSTTELTVGKAFTASLWGAVLALR